MTDPKNVLRNQMPSLTGPPLAPTKINLDSTEAELKTFQQQEPP